MVPDAGLYRFGCFLLKYQEENMLTQEAPAELSLSVLYIFDCLLFYKWPSLTGLPNTKSKVVVKLIFTAQYSLPSLANTKKGSLKIFTVAKPRIGRQHKKTNLILSFTELPQRTACPETHNAACLLHLCSGKEK